MLKGDLVAGRKYALRQKKDRTTLVKVTFRGVLHGSQVKVRFDDGELAGLEDWVTTRELVCPWGERKTLLRDEACAAALEKNNYGHWDRVYEDAISEVFTASGEETGFMRKWNTDEGSATRLWARAGLSGSPLDADVCNYVDRAGRWHLSFDTALQAAKGFAAQEPALVDLYCSDEEEKYRAQGYEPGNRYVHDMLRLYAPAWALIRSWMQQPSRTADQQEIERLRQLIQRTAYTLKNLGHPREAAELQRALQGQ